MDVKKLIQNAIVDIWKNEIKHDYENNLILNEETLKINLCYHLRNKLRDNILNDNLRVIPEFRVPKFKKQVDIAIVELKETRDIFLHINDNIKSILALIELKFFPIKLYNFTPMLLTENIKKCDRDIFKLNEIGKKFDNVLLVGAFIDEYLYHHKSGLNRLFDISEFIEVGVLNRLIELNGFNYEYTGEFITSVSEPPHNV